MIVLKQLVVRMHEFIRLAVEKLINLSVSKHQEAELKEMMKNFNVGFKEQTLRI